MRRLGALALAAALLGGLSAPSQAQTYPGVWACATHQWLSGVTIGGAPACSQPGTADISGAGTAITANTGTSGHAIPFLDGINTWSGGQLAFPIAGSVSGAVTLQMVGTGTYNFNYPTAAGTSGFPLLSGGGGGTAQTYGQLGNAALANMAAWTFKGNATAGSATPTDVTIDGLTNKASPAGADEVIIWDIAGAAWKKATVSSVGSAGSVSSIAGNTGAFTLSHGLTNSTNDIRLALNSATLQASPSNPSGTSSASFVMMGLGSTCAITPVYSTRLQVAFQGNIGNNTINDAAGLHVMFGTGSAPSNAAASTGTQVGSSPTNSSSAAGASHPFNVGGIITGLTAGTAYWFDLAVEAIGAGTATVVNPSCSAMEF